MKSATKKNLLSTQHLFVAIILITKGYGKVEHLHNLIGWTILLFGIIVLGYFIFLKFSKREYPFLEISIHLFESVALFLTTYIYFKEGKTFLPYVTLVAGIGFLIAFILHLKKHKK